MTLRRKNGWKGLWHLPGGTVHYLEKVKDAVKRIAKEELGIDVKIKKFLQYLEYFEEGKQRGYGYSVSLVFLCTTKELNFVLDDDVEKINFFQTPPDNTVAEHKNILSVYF